MILSLPRKGRIGLEHQIIGVTPHGVAYRRGIRAGDTLLSINGEELIDQIDYEALCQRVRLDLGIRRADGTEETVRIVKARETPLGLEMADTLACKPRTCQNRCIFCFIDQMPPNMRKTLYVKDDDWRLSLMMGNYVTLTNVDEKEFDRIIRRKASPLYISVHTTDPALRCRMMHNKNAGRIMERLQRLKDANLHFHCQIVLCPGYNDGEALKKTLRDLSSLWPAAQSAALVPVGLTRFREGLDKISPFDREGAAAVVEIARAFQRECLQRFGTRFVFPSDEMLLLAGEEMPLEEEYEGYPQIENGVGLLRQFEEELKAAAQENQLAARKRRLVLPCGVSIAPVMKKWIEAYGPGGVDVQVLPVVNRFFGETITVTGLLTGGDLRCALQAVSADEILLCSNTLRSEGDLFLDDMPLSALRNALPCPLTVVPNTGGALFAALLGRGDT